MATSVELRRQCQGLAGQKSQYESRRRELINVRNYLNNSLGGHISAINTSVFDTQGNYDTGVKGTVSSQRVAESLEAFNQKGIATDGNMGTVLNYVNEEISRCDRKISQLNTDIATKNSQIRTAQQRELQERLEAFKKG